MWNRRTFSVCASAVIALAMSHTASAIVIYVDDDAPPGGDGLTWNTAFRFLRDGFAFANNYQNNVTEVRIAQGTYKPDRSEATPAGTGDIHDAFEMGNYQVQGGFAGINAADPDARDITAYETVLTGDLLDNDQAGFVNYEDNSMNLILGPTSVEGCTIRSARVGVRDNCNLSCCRLIHNLTAVNIDDALCHASYCTFDQNQRGIHNDWGFQIVVDHCQFSRHEYRVFAVIEAGPAVARHCGFTDNNGGIASVIEGSSFTFENCRFSGNSAIRGGIASLYAVTAGSSARFVNCEFRSNSSQRGGVLYSTGNENSQSRFTCINCLFFDNSATDAGGAIYSYRSNGTVINCTFVRNNAPRVGAIYNANHSTLKVYNSIIKGNPGGCFGGNGTRTVNFSNIGGGHEGAGNVNIDPRFRDANAGNLRLKASSLCIDAGRKSIVPTDIVIDLDGNRRFVNNPATPNTGVGSPPVDMGAYEFQPN